jgi:hypothetical protein
MRKRFRFVALTAAALFLPLGSVEAATQTLSGAECLYQLGGTRTVSEYAEVLNVSTIGDLTVVCPIHRVGPDATISSPAVVVHDRNANSGKYVDCTLRCVDDLSVSSSTTNATTSGVAGGTAEFHSLNMLAPGQYSGGACLFACQIPRSVSGVYSGISRYRVTQSAP